MDTKDPNNETKSKSLPPSRALNDKRRSNSRGALSQSRDSENKEKDQERHKRSPEEREELEFAEKLKKAETQEERDRLLARRQKFGNNFQPIESTKKVISLKSKADNSINEESFGERRVRKAGKEPEDTLDMFNKDNLSEKNTADKVKGKVF